MIERAAAREKTLGDDPEAIAGIHLNKKGAEIDVLPCHAVIGVADRDIP